MSQPHDVEGEPNSPLSVEGPLPLSVSVQLPVACEAALLARLRSIRERGPWRSAPGNSVCGSAIGASHSGAISLAHILALTLALPLCGAAVGWSSGVAPAPRPDISLLPPLLAALSL